MNHARVARNDIATDHQRLVVCPSVSRRSRGQAVAGFGWIVASLLYSLRFHGQSRLIVVCLGIAVAVGVIGLLNLSRRRTRLTVVGRRVVLSGLIRDRVVLDGDQAGRVVDVEVSWGGATRRRSRLWLLLDSTDHSAVGLNRAAWNAAELETVRRRLDLPLEVQETPRRPAELRTAYPGSIPWWGAHPIIATWLAIFILTMLILGMAILAGR